MPLPVLLPRGAAADAASALLEEHVLETSQSLERPSCSPAMRGASGSDAAELVDAIDDANLNRIAVEEDDVDGLVGDLPELAGSEDDDVVPLAKRRPRPGR
ncbi:Os09g0501032 [Oryza sativa Japonica Group]|uniref:Os09g0501032 protein n=1 Tax=Oryza sativa subsp. japonica TaxID=39947 RepID=A0A0P0XPR8_ORYSJ|nr:Os09g0501032 [Oryza sativa Japonica Group]